MQKNSPVITVSDKWLPKSEVRKFLNYGETQMCALEKKGELIVTRVGKRKFILRDSVAKLLDGNIVISIS